MKCQTCPTQIKNHKWAKIKASSAGWFFTKDGRAFCPNHIPDWVKNWRASGGPLYGG